MSPDEAFAPPSLPQRRSSSLVGLELGKCRIVGELGSGAMGTVYRAEHEAHGEVCVKVIDPDQAATGNTLRRFRREAEAAMRINDVHVVRGFGLEEVDGYQLLVQELVDGGDLETHLRDRGGVLTLAEALRFGRQVAIGLRAAHAEGLVHRDLKPGNILLDKDNRVKIADLGLVLQIDGDDPLDGSGRTALTQKGMALGTPLYMAPEQWKGAHDVDHRADLYALGVLLYQLLSGQPPFAGSSIAAIMAKHVLETPPSLSMLAPEVPVQIALLVHKLLEKDPNARPRTADVVVRAIEQVASDDAHLSEAVRATQIVPCSGSDAATSDELVTPAPAPALDATVAGDPPLTEPGRRIVKETVAVPAPTGLVSGVPPMPATDPGAATVAGIPTPAPASLLGQVIGEKFRLLSILGRGGMGMVFRAEHTLLKEEFALKVIRSSFAQHPEFRSRFLTEAKALLSFVHPGAVSLREFGEHEGSLYMTLDYARGETLAQILHREGPISEERTLSIARQVLPCLQVAHEAGLVHRDLKPENLMIERLPDGSERVRVLDFGIAKILHDAAEAIGAERDLTGTGISVGTPHYMSPEQAAGDEVDDRSDIYSFACILYECLSGRRPIDADTKRKLLFKIVMEPPERLAKACGRAVAPMLAEAVETGLAKKVKDRPLTALAYLHALEEAWEAVSDQRKSASGHHRITRIGSGMRLRPPGRKTSGERRAKTTPRSGKAEVPGCKHCSGEMDVPHAPPEDDVDATGQPHPKSGAHKWPPRRSRKSDGKKARLADTDPAASPSRAALDPDRSGSDRVETPARKKPGTGRPLASAARKSDPAKPAARTDFKAGLRWTQAGIETELRLAAELAEKEREAEAAAAVAARPRRGRAAAIAVILVLLAGLLTLAVSAALGYDITHLAGAR